MLNLKQQINFILTVEELKRVRRQTTVKADGDRRENSAEHSWHIALMAQVFQDYAAEKINISRVVLMLLLHDVVEIETGDLFAFADAADLDLQSQNERAAADRLFGLLPDQQGLALKEIWLEFELADSPDAKFAKAMDRILPLLQNMQSEGGTWVEHGIAKSQVLVRNQYLEKAAPKLWAYVCEQIEEATRSGWLKNDAAL